MGSLSSDPQSGDEVRLSRCDDSSGQQWFPANTGQWILNDRDSNCKFT